MGREARLLCERYNEIRNGTSQNTPPDRLDNWLLQSINQKGTKSWGIEPPCDDKYTQQIGAGGTSQAKTPLPREDSRLLLRSRDCTVTSAKMPGLIDVNWRQPNINF
jgi:hypothetical protein